MSATHQELARRNQATLLRALAETTQKKVAELAGVSETALSRMKDDDGEFAKLCRVLAACDLAVVPQSYKLVDPDKLQALRVLAREAINMETRVSEWGSF